MDSKLKADIESLSGCILVIGTGETCVVKLLREVDFDHTDFNSLIANEVKDNRHKHNDKPYLKKRKGRS